MEKVNFFDHENLERDAQTLFIAHKELIKKQMPSADVLHIGSTAIPGSLTKGDLDIQVRVSSEQFFQAVDILSSLYESNEGSIKTEEFRAFKSDLTNLPLGVQLTVIDSEYDFFWKFRDILLQNDQYRVEYDKLKRKYQGKEMDEYREAKSNFFDKIMQTPEFKKLKVPRDK